MQNIPFRRRPLLWILCGAFCFVFTWSAWAPLSREDWWMENVLVFIIVTVLVAGYPHLRLSDLSYTLIFVFLCLHEVGAHYTYEQVPIGFWMKDTFHFRRNDYDRIVHFMFGFCWSFPTREFFLQAAKAHKFWSYSVPPAIMLAVSAFYEIIEAYTAMQNPGMEAQFVGLQGDIFDSQRDMTCALLGALVMMTIAAIAQYEGELKDIPDPAMLTHPQHHTTAHHHDRRTSDGSHD